MIPTFGNLYPARGWPLMALSACYCGPGQGMVGGHFVAEVHRLGGGLEAQDDALQAGHVGVPGAEIGAPGDEGVGGGGYGGVLAAGGRWPPVGIIAFAKRSFTLMVLKSP